MTTLDVSARKRGVYRWLRSVVVAAFVALAGFSTPAAASLAQTDLSQPSGPLTDADRDLLTKVRLAGLWEGPISAQVASRTSNPKVKPVAEQLSREHHALDEATLAVAAKLVVGLPDAPTTQQQMWMTQILSAPPDQSDKMYANITRAAHGSVFSVIAKVRSSTRNDEIRAFAQVGIETVMRHMTLLESTGLVDSTSLLVPINGPTGAVATAPSLPDRSSVLMGIALAIVASVATLYVVRRLGNEPPQPGAAGGYVPIRAEVRRHRELT